MIEVTSISGVDNPEVAITIKDNNGKYYYIGVYNI